MARIAKELDLYPYADWHDEKRTLKAASSSHDKTVFLSYASADKHLLVSTIALLESHGGRVYCDADDLALPRPPGPTTAPMLRHRIASCQRLVQLVSYNSHRSQWLPWEIGIADGIHSELCCATLPVLSSTSIANPDTSWISSSFLTLYGCVMRDGDSWVVEIPRRRSAISLRAWLRGDW